jgi:outer membrane protein OmpA-like peptidoglycan-associated protein
MLAKIGFMKRIYLSLFSLVFAISCFAQAEYKKSHAVGFSFTLHDFTTPAAIKSKGFAGVVREKQLFRIDNMEPGVAVNYVTGLADHLDFAGALGMTFLSPLRYEFTAGFNLKMLTDKYLFVPFINAGVGASTSNGYYGAFTPVGAGMQVNFSNLTFLLLNSQYRIPVTQNSTSHLYYSITLVGNIGNERKAVPKQVELPVVTDRDADGVVDSSDVCPDIAGLPALNGCPDKDADGIADSEDSCADVAGTSKYHGCPVPDTDKDGINDEEDKCPAVAGVARYQGCPVPDTDGDGVNDEEDKCAKEAGVPSNFGCPEIKPEVIEKVNLAARNIFFATGSARLLAKSYESLNDVVNALTENPTYKVDIEGHTDSTGSAERNHVLSHDRANSVKAYLLSKGIEESRITTEGYGPDRPIASNKTSAGRAQNRRVEMRLKNY